MCVCVCVCVVCEVLIFVCEFVLRLLMCTSVLCVYVCVYVYVPCVHLFVCIVCVCVSVLFVYVYVCVSVLNYRYGYSTPPERKQKKLMKSQSTPVTSSFEDLLKSESQESPFLGKSDLTETLEDDDLQLDESMFEQHPTIPSVVEKTKSEACLPEVLNSHNQLHKTKPVEDLSKRHRHASDPYKNGSVMLDTSTDGKSEGGSFNKKDYQSVTEISHSTSKGGTVGVGGVISSRRSSETSDIQSDLSDAASLDHSFRRDRFFYDDSGVSTAVEGPSRASQGEEEGKGERGGDGLAGSEGVRRHSHSEVDPKRKGGKLAKDVISPEIIKSKSDSDFRSSNKMPPRDNIGIFESSLMSSDSKVEQTRLRDESSHKTAATKPIDSQVDREGIDSPPTLTQTESSSDPGEKRLYSDESTRSEAEKMSADSPHEEKSSSVTVAKIREMFQKKEPQGVQFPTLLAKSELQKQKLQSKLVTERTIQLLQRHKAAPQPKIAHPLEQSKQSPSLKRQASSSSPSARENSPLLTQRSNVASRSPVINHVHGGPNEEKPTQARSNTPLEESENTSSDNNNDDDDIDEPLDLETHDKESASSEETPTSVSSSSTSLTHAHAHAHAQAEKAVPPPPPPSSIPLFFTPLTGIQFRRQRAELLRSSISSNNNDNNKNKNKNNHRDNNSKSTQLNADKSIYPVWDESPPSSEESEEEEEEEGDELVQPLQSHTGLPPGSHDDGGRQRLPRYGSGSSATTAYASHTAGTRGTEEANSNNKSKPQLSPQLMSHVSRNRQVKHSTPPRADLPQALATSSSVMAAKRHPPQPPFRRQQQQNRRNLSAIPEEPPSP